jgi:peroxidase
MRHAWWKRGVGPKAQTRPRRRRFPFTVEELEPRCLLAAGGFRPITEIGNNLANPTWGTANTDLLRVAPAAYADGLSAPALPQDPSARALSNIINNQADPNDPSQNLQIVNKESLSAFAYAFGQFIDHDMDLTPDGGASFPIAVAAGDPIGPNPLPFTRSQFDPNTGTTNPRQQVNTVTSFLDLSQVYGSDLTRANALRTFSGGLLKTSPGNMLPYDSSVYFGTNPIDMQNQGALPLSDLFATGDVRGNENLELTALQTLYVRNHNRIAVALQKNHPDWSDEQLYQEARKSNIAQYQSIIYNEWIPAVLGANALPAYTGYNPKVNPSIANEFSTVAFRFGHSLLSDNIERQTNQGVDIPDVSPDGATISLAQDFFDPNLLNPNGVVDPVTGHTTSDIDAVLKGSADDNAQAMDVLVINDVRNLLFGSFGAGGQDLIARDIQRARDNGIPGYNTLRAALGLRPVTSFAQISSDPSVQAKLRAAYGQTNGHDNVNNIDAFEGGLAEDHVPGADVGPLFQAIMANQFTRLRNGDRFFYLNESFTWEELSLFQQGNTLTKVIEANTALTNLQSNAFLFKASISGTVFFAGGFFNPFGQRGVSGITVQLMDDNGNILATTVTDSFGRYSFNQLSGPAANPDTGSGISQTGSYNVVLVLPSGLKQITPNPSSILISRGGLNVTGINFGVDFNFFPWADTLMPDGIVG